MARRVHYLSDSNFSILLEQILRADAAVVVYALDGVGKQSGDTDDRGLGATGSVKRY